MSPRAKKFIGLIILLPALVVYFGAVVTLAERVPAFWLVKLAYFIITGLAWALPVIPLMKWMNREPGENEQSIEEQKSAE